MNQPQQKFEQRPLGQQIQTVRNLMPYPALPTMCILRPDLGYRLVNPAWLGPVTAVEIGLAVCFPPAGNGINPLFDFALVTFGLGIYQRFQGWRKIEAGINDHTFYMGTSRLRFSWLPEVFKKNRRCERFLDPILAFAVGTVLLPVWPLFGFWVCVTAACLRFFESEIYTKEKNERLNITDGMITSQIQAQVVEKFEGGSAAGAQQPPAEVSTGMDDDILARINRKKQNN